MARPRKYRVEETPKPASATPAEESPLTSGASGCAEPLSPALAADADKARPGPGDTADSVPGSPDPLHIPTGVDGAVNTEPVIESNNDLPSVTDPIHTLIRYTAEKLSARSEGLIFYALGCHEETGELFLKITGNQGRGLYSKEWIALSEIDGILRSLPADKPFKSSVMKRLFKGGSANNAGFLSAILRSDGLKLIQKADGNPMLHELVPDYLERLGSLTNELCTLAPTFE
ncbi:hypothetical protein [Aeromonas caviae]|uniref:hypothetical protein n=1 Tax=Aeromonas caviae TaxID=648 RepID=UPI002255D904|nr:hypothetical protein [Aeromonas caviae]MCX4033187.1 hypothetical protein [Aeromonas caviae]